MLRAGDGVAAAAPVVGAVRHAAAAGVDAGDDVDVVVAPVAVVVVGVVVGAGVVAGALVAAVLAAVGLAVGLVVGLAVGLVVGLAVELAVVLAAAAAAACVGSMTHKARDECLVQRASKAWTVVELVVAGDGCETAWFGTMSCASGRIGAADLVHGSFARLARLGKESAKTAGESQVVLVAISSIGIVNRATNVAFDLFEARKASSL